ncbi:MAG: pilus assembly protein TadG-related protein [Candidatus Binataceae bacterium]
MHKLKRALVPLLALSKGQIAVLFTLVAVTMIGAMALGTDIGVFYINWVRLQKAADSAALAGANYLPNDPDTAKSTAINFAENNGIAASEISEPTLCCDASGVDNTQITVRISRTVPYYFGRLLGLTSGSVAAASATAALPGGPTTIGGPTLTGSSGGGSSGGSSSGGSGGGTPANPICGTSAGQYDVLPIAVSDQTASQYVQGNSYTLNRTGDGGSWVDAPGNWGFVQLCQSGNGDPAIRNAIADGFYGPISVGQTIQTIPGDRGNSLNNAWNSRMNSPDDPSNFDPGVDPRAVIIPMVSGFSTCTGTCTVTITGFLAFYIDSANGSGVTGHFVKMEAFTSIGTGTSADAGVTGNPVLIK